MDIAKTRLLAVALTAALGAWGAHAQTSGPASGSTASGSTASGSASSGGAATSARSGSSKDGAGKAAELTRADRDFIRDAAAAGTAETRAAQLALQKARSDDVKRFAQHMLDEHGRSNERLMRLASDLGAAPPSETDRATARRLDRLGRLSGDEFDREYMRMQVDDHKKAISLYEREARNGRNAELKSFAADTLPRLRDHLAMAQGDMGKLPGAAAARGDRSTSPATGGGPGAGTGRAGGTAGTSPAAGSPGSGNGPAAPGGSANR